MLHQGQVVVLGQDNDIRDAGVGHAGQDEVAQAVTAGERHGSHGTQAHQVAQQLIEAVGENDTHCIVVHHRTAPSFTSFLTRATFFLSLAFISAQTRVAPAPTVTPV